MVSSPVPTVPARPAQQAHDAFGMNVHLGFQKPDNTNRFTEPTVDLLLELGVGRVRQKLYCDQGRSREATRAGLHRLMAAGVRVCAPTLVMADATSLDAASARMEAYLDELERNPDHYDLGLLAGLPGLNEPNGGRQRPPDWAERTRWAQQAIHDRTRARSAFDHVPIQGPPLSRPGGQHRRGGPGGAGRRRGMGGAGMGGAAAGGARAAGFAARLAEHAAAVGDLSAWVDLADLHIYSGDADSLRGGPPQVFVESVRDMYLAAAPIVVTESGWSNCSPDDPDGQLYAGGGRSCPESVTAKYAPKAPLNALLLGYQTVYAYEMLENQSPYADHGHALRGAKFGYIRTPGLDPSTWEPKAQFHAIRRFLALFADPGPAFTPAGLPLAVTGDCPDLQWLLFQRRDGRHLLALWRAADLYSCDPRTNVGNYLQVAPVPVTVAFDAPRPVSSYRPSSQDGPVSQHQEARLSVDLGDELVVLQIG